ncbi:hypothetical protein [Candidatus Methylomirabilis sp.]|uniref:Lipoprotein n=1 Tax=Candidatus Methylomirabilis tolerans TaxID=3123416 RepID=A0AAJ1AI18_9BACT|nr:hypothetical protein [Candidatus Methylomirabilis sp.]
MRQLHMFWGQVRGALHRLMRQTKPMGRPLTTSILILATVAQFGCASLPVLTPPPGEAVLKVAVTSGRFAPTFDTVMGPAKGASGGALKGAVMGLGGLIFAPFTVPLGLVIGATMAEPSAKIEERETAAREIVTAQRIQENIRDRVVAVGRAKTPHAFIALANRGPSTISERPDYRPLSQEGIQTVLEVVADRVKLHGNMIRLDPALQMVMFVNWRLVRTADNAEIYSASLPYIDFQNRGVWTLARWVNDPEIFRSELDRAYTGIAEMIVRLAFVQPESK